MRNSTKYRAIYSTIWSQFGKSTEIALLFILSIILARGFGPEDYGIYASLLAFFNFITMISSFGLEQMLTNYVPKSIRTKNNKKAYFLLKSALILRILILGSLLAIITILSKPIASIYFGNKGFYSFFLIVSIYIFFKEISKLISFFYIGKLNTKFVAVIDNSSLIAIIIVSLIIFKTGYGLRTIFIYYAIIYFIAFIVYFWDLKKYFFKSSKIWLERENWRFSKTIWINSAMGYVLGKQSDILMLQWFNVQNIQIGFYNLSFSIVSLAGSILMAGLAIVALPIMSESNSTGGQVKLRKIWRLILSFSSLVSVPIFVFLILNSQQIVSFIYSKKYLGCAFLISIFAFLSLFGRILGGGVNTAALYAINKERYIMYITFFTGILNIALNLILIPIFGAIGALVGTGLSSGISICIIFSYVIKFLKPLYPLKLTFKILFAAIISGFLSYLLIGIHSLNLIFIGLLYVITYFSILALLKPFEKDDAEEFRSIPILYFFLKRVSHNANG